jgi:RNA polymerase sigma factor (sigma-70 family)
MTSGLRGGGFPTTAISQVLAARSEDPDERARSFESLSRAYYKPVYKYVRLRWKKSEDEATDITQEFFSYALEQGIFARYEPDRARVRTYVRLCLDGFISKRERAARALKRGGNTPPVSFDVEGIEREIAYDVIPASMTAEDYFDAEWTRHLLSTSVETLRRECEAKSKSRQLAIFERLDLCDNASARPTYSEVACALGISVVDVANGLSYARREFRSIVLDTLRELTATEEEFRSEALAVLGIRV